VTFLKFSHITSNWPIKETPHASPQEVAMYDIHVKPLPCSGAADLDSRLSQIEHLERETQRLRPTIGYKSEGRQAEINCSKTFKETLKTIDRICEKIRSDPAQTIAHNTMELSEADITTYAEHDLIEKCPEDKQMIDIRLFSTVEDKPLHNKPRRRRGITHTPLENEYATWFSKPMMHAPVEQMHHVHLRALCIDFAAFFNQIRLGKRQYWAFRDKNGQRWQIKTIPTGACFSPLIAQLITEAICQWLMATCPMVRADCFLDNIRVTGHDDYAVRFAMGRCMAKLKELNIVVNESASDIADMDTQNFTYLGVKYALSEEIYTTELTPKLRGKVVEILEKASTGSMLSDATLREMLRSFGILTFASMVLDIPRAKYYHFIKFMRRKAAQGAALDEPANPWAAAIRTLRAWALDTIKKEKNVIHRSQRSAEQWDIFSDASDSGFGVVILTPRETIIRAGRWDDVTQQTHINIKEAKALLHAMEETAEAAKVRRIRPKRSFWVDNTSVIGATHNTASSSFHLNEVIHQIRCMMKSSRMNRDDTLKYVTSENNIADAPSRHTQNMHVQGGMYRTSWFDALFSRNTMTNQPPRI
jgi:hypothetical protein